MSDPFVAEIRIFAGNFAPRYWAACDGQLISIAQNTALFSLLGTTYGGNGTSTFALPDLRGRAPMFWGQGPGLTSRSLGEQDGQAAVTLQAGELPSHTHALLPTSAPAQSASPAGANFADAEDRFYAPGPARTALSPAALGAAGGSAAHNNLQPYLVLTFIIALAGIYPPRS